MKERLALLDEDASVFYNFEDVLLNASTNQDYSLIFSDNNYSIQIRTYEIQKIFQNKKYFERASDYYKKLVTAPRCSTGSKRLDNLLRGGIETSAITEFYGEYSSGKSQICMTLSVMCQRKKEEGGLEGGVIYIDTEGTFRPDRVSEIASFRGLDPRTVLDGIFYTRIADVESLEGAIESSLKLVEDQKIKLVVIDSLIAPFRAEFLGRESLQERQQRLNRVLYKLKTISEAYDLAVVVTNQVSSNPNPFVGERLRATGGNVMAHATTHRIFLYRQGQKRFAKIVDSPSMPQSETEFSVGPSGVE
ncbi:MAG: DNA repair and recombination protein RadA [Nitrososphaeria archaeon]|jgi:DNA repair protein RadA|nr:DNA repair and recombination protein RadA [Conexivisphaerales archaeon]